MNACQIWSSDLQALGYFRQPRHYPVTSFAETYRLFDSLPAIEIPFESRKN
jgi:hypothetical protein